MVYAQLRIGLGEWYTQSTLGFWDIYESPNLGQTTRPNNNNDNNKKKNCLVVDLMFRQITKEKRKKARSGPGPCLGTEKLWNIKLTVIPIVIGALGTVTKGLIQRLDDLEIRGRVETIQTTTIY